jgi:hypothetical protein
MLTLYIDVSSTVLIEEEFPLKRRRRYTRQHGVRTQKAYFAFYFSSCYTSVRSKAVEEAHHLAFFGISRSNNPYRAKSENIFQNITNFS